MISSLLRVVRSTIVQTLKHILNVKKKSCVNCDFICTPELIFIFHQLPGTEDFHSVVWAGTKQLDVKVDSLHLLVRFGFVSVLCTSYFNLKYKINQAGVDVIREKHPKMEIRDDIDQFITRIIEVIFVKEIQKKGV